MERESSGGEEREREVELERGTRREWVGEGGMERG